MRIRTGMKVTKSEKGKDDEVTTALSLQCNDERGAVDAHAQQVG